MSDEEIMRKFNETFNDNPVNNSNNNGQSVNVEPYRVTNNLNATTNVPLNANVTNNVSSNIQQSEKKEIKDLLSSDTSAYSSYNSSTDGTNNQIRENNNNQYQSNVNYNYIPTYARNKPKKATVKLSKENLIFLGIIVILFIFIMIIPSIYDVIRQIKMR